MLKWLFVKKHKGKVVSYIENALSWTENKNTSWPKFSREIDLDHIMELRLKRKTFVQKLEEHIKNKGLLSIDIYKPAHVDRKLFSKIICNKEYQPSKDTAIALALGLRLSLPDVQELLGSAGYTLSRSIKRDIIIEYFIKEGIYSIDKINAVLYSLNEKTIGRSV